MMQIIIILGVGVLISSLIAFGVRIERNRRRAQEADHLADVIHIHDKINTKLNETNDRINAGLSVSDINSMLSTYHDTDKH